MKILRIFVILTAAFPPLMAVEIGDSYDQVIAEKGAPAAKMQAGEIQILNYPEQRIKLKGNKVVEVNAKLPEAASAPAEPPAARAPGIPPGTWTTDYPAALRQARQQKTKVFLFFTGSDWCGWCKRLDREILSTDQFGDYAGKNLVLVKLDFPRGIPQSASLKAQNEQLAQHHKVGGFPTVIVVDSNGKPMGRLGYQAGGPGGFIAALKKF
ncbi:MAG: thioredoxin [Rariglobus sp.]|jgi:protein disulfide-isomerase|nr:thioredoxin [Rariglobus sp.]